jgi:lipopolysaccharide export LptBFGC system permease protein LptF
MVFTLHRYIFREAFKVFVLAAVALTLILSLGSILRPIQEYGVGPQHVLYLMGYFLPITLTFILPMAALFAASLVYGRFASDNELDACRASGISLVTLVYPGLVLAIIVAIANLILSFHVMPVFIQRAEESLKADAKKIIFRNIQRSGYYKLPDGRYLVYADNADLQNDILSGVVVAELKGVEIKRIVTAENAKVQFNPHQRFNEVKITAYKTYQMDPDGDTASAEWLPITAEFGSLLGDDIKFKRIDEMKRIRVDPIRFYPVEKMARSVYAQFITELLAEDITSKIGQLRSGGDRQESDFTGDSLLQKEQNENPANEKTAHQGAPEDTDRFYKLHSGQKLVEFTAGQCALKDEKKVLLSDNVVVIEYNAGSKVPLQELVATKALLHIEGDELAPTLTMEIYNPTWRRADGSEGLSRLQIIRGLILPQHVMDKIETEDVLKAISPASISSALQEKPSSILQELQNKLQRKIQRTFVEIKAEIHSRLVFGIGCVLLIMIGIGLGIMKKGGHLLSAFGVSSVPAAVLIVCIMMGKNITKNPGAQAVSGIILMWASLVLLLSLAVVIYHKLLKN